MTESKENSIVNCEIKGRGPLHEISKLLECPICQGIFIPPIWNCVTGHSVCNNCRNQLTRCGLCRKPYSQGRNFIAEEILAQCQLSCPHGCNFVGQLKEMKVHVADGNCEFERERPMKVKWITCQNGRVPLNAIVGGIQSGVNLYVIRAHHEGSITPGKLYNGPSNYPFFDCSASWAWGGDQHFKQQYEVLVANAGDVKWIPSSHGAMVSKAIPGGTSETGEVLFIGRFKYKNDMINGKIHPSHQCCYIGIDGMEKKQSQNYEILVGSY